MAQLRASAERRTSRSRQLRVSTLKRLVFVWAIGLIGLAAAAIQTSVPVEMLLLDASVVGGGHWYSGLVTSLAVLGWTTAAVCTGCAGYASHCSSRFAAARTFGLGAGLMALLLLDDLFQLHSSVVPRAIGGGKLGLLAFEAAALVLWLATSWREISRTRWELLLAAGCGFAASVILDLFPVGDARLALILEDGGKILGVLALATWSVSSAADLIASTSRAPMPRSDESDHEAVVAAPEAFVSVP